MKKIYFISGRGVKKYFDSKAYQNPDSAAVEEGQRLAKIFKDVTVTKIVGFKTETIYRSITEKELCQQRLAKFHFTPRKRVCAS